MWFRPLYDNVRTTTGSAFLDRVDTGIQREIRSGLSRTVNETSEPITYCVVPPCSNASQTADVILWLGTFSFRRLGSGGIAVTEMQPKTSPLPSVLLSVESFTNSSLLV